MQLCKQNMKIHRFKSISISKAYKDYSRTSLIYSIAVLFFLIVTMIIADAVRLSFDFIDDLSNFAWLFFLAIVFFGVVILGRKSTKKCLNTAKGPLLFFFDVLYLGGYVALAIVYHYWVLTRKMENHQILFIGFELCAYHFMILSTMSHSWIHLMSILAMNVADIVLGLLLFPDSTKSWIITMGVVILVEFYLIYIQEIHKRKHFENTFELQESLVIWKDLLLNLPEGVLLFDRKQQLKFLNFSIKNIFQIQKEPNYVLDVPLQRIVFPQAKRTHRISTFKTIAKKTEKNEVDMLYAELAAANDLKELIETVFNKWEDLSNLIFEYTKAFQFTGTLEPQKGEPTDSKRGFDIKVAFKEFDGRIHCLVTLSDITDTTKVQTLKQNLVKKDKMLASVSHELRTPLNGNINFIQAAIDYPTVPENIKELYLIPALRCGKYLLSLINDILDMSQIQNDSLRLVPFSKKLVSTIQEAMQLIEIQAKKKKLYLDLVLPYPTFNPSITTDHNRVIQILANLLSNSLKFTFKGGIKVIVTPEQDGRVYEIAVEDTGIGIKDENKGKLFKEFGKLDLGAENTLNAQGVGLGLMISNSLAAMLGQKEQDGMKSLFGLGFESEFGKGSKFFFKLADQADPVIMSRDSVALQTIPTEGDAVGKYDNYKKGQFFVWREGDKSRRTSSNTDVPTCKCAQILIADDDSFNLTALETILSSLQYTSLSCYNGREVIDEMMNRIKNPCSDDCKPFTMILLDMNMGVMNGYQTAKELNIIFAKFPNSRCPIIGCSGNSQKDEIKSAMACGLDDYCVKPINKSVIKQLCNKFVEVSTEM